MSIDVSKQLSNYKIPVISFCFKYKVMSPEPKSVAVADGVWEQMMKHVVLSVLHCLEQCFICSISKLLSSGIICAIEVEPDPSADECFDTLFI